MGYIIDHGPLKIYQTCLTYYKKRIIDISTIESQKDLLIKKLKN